jgi:hypothetical protein
MRGMVTKEEATCKTSISVKINGILKFLGQSKFGGLTAFGTFKSCRGGYRVSYARTLKMSSKQSVGLMTLTGKHRSVQPIEKSEYRILKFRRIGVFKNLHTTNQIGQEI